MRMGCSSRVLLVMVRGGAAAPPLLHQQRLQQQRCSLAQRLLLSPICIRARRRYSARAALLPPDLPRLAETARISLTPREVEEFAPKIRQVIDWFGQLQAVELQSIEPALRAEIEGDNVRSDLPETFENREALLAAVPSYEEPYIKVPKVLNKE